MAMDNDALRELFSKAIRSEYDSPYDLLFHEVEKFMNAGFTRKEAMEILLEVIKKGV